MMIERNAQRNSLLSKGAVRFRERVSRGDVSVRRELVCGNCGYGISVEVPPSSCPMCQRFEWRPLAPKPAARFHAPGGQREP